jgi:HupE / UreJ protein
MSYHCPAPIHVVTITSALFVREHPGHRTFAIVHDASSATSVRQDVFGPGSETLELTLDRRAAGRGQATIEVLRLGVRHVFTRGDQLLVMLGLLLAAAGTRDVVKVAAAFTVAYTATLALAALGLMTVDGRLLAGGSALTIALVGLANLVLPGYAGRWQAAFACGLVHGFGFANVLGELHVPPTALGTSLAAFNAGIESGLLLAVCLLYPPIAWLRAQRWGGPAMRGVSAAIALAGIYLLIERALLST